MRFWLLALIGLVFLHKGKSCMKHWGDMTPRFPREDDQRSVSQRERSAAGLYHISYGLSHAALALASDFWPTELLSSCHVSVWGDCHNGRECGFRIRAVCLSLDLSLPYRSEHLNSVSVFLFWKMGLAVTSVLQCFVMHIRGQYRRVSGISNTVELYTVSGTVFSSSQAQLIFTQSFEGQASSFLWRNQNRDRPGPLSMTLWS